MIIKLCVTVALCLFFSNSAWCCTLRVAWEDWPPYFFINNNGFEGADYRFIRNVSQKAGCSLVFKELPWNRALHDLSLGKVDLLYGASFTNERDSFAQYTIAYRIEKFVMVARIDSPDFISFDQWKSYAPIQRLGVIRGFYYGDLLQARLLDSELKSRTIAVRSNRQLLAMLRKERIDAYWIESGVADMKIELSGLKFFDFSEIPGEPMHLMFSNYIPKDIVQKFNQLIAAELSEKGGRR